ncbi:MAG: transglycosylase family protein [Propionibacteriaceae bacterium]|nr:transglycosylase family protein [Propionibacteriaceae bacterium]
MAGLITTALVGGAALVNGGVAVADTATGDLAVWDRVAQCESGGNWSINTGNGYYGGLQFSSSTWKAFGGRTYANQAHQASKAEQIAIARRTLHGQGPGAWPTCGRKAGLTRSNGGADPKATPGNQPAAPAPSKPNNPAPPSNTTLTVNGRLDKATIVAMQKWVGTAADGIWGPKTSRALQAKVGARQTGARDRQTTVAVQKLVGSTPDGIWGPKTTTALQKYLLNGAPGTPAPQPPAAQPPAAQPPASNPEPGQKVAVTGRLDRATIVAMQKWVGTAADGIWGPKTSRALQEKVGARVTGLRDRQTTVAVQTKTGSKPDGIWGPKTTTALQQYLNQHA